MNRIRVNGITRAAIWPFWGRSVIVVRDAETIKFRWGLMQQGITFSWPDAREVHVNLHHMWIKMDGKVRRRKPEESSE